MSRPIKFSNIIIIQSLSLDEQQTGEEIERQIKFACFKRNIQPLGLLYKVNTKTEFFKLLDDILKSIDYGMMPYLHFEMHGYEGGLSLANNETITWEELKQPIRNINIKCGNNLFISLASCYGANLLDLYEGEFDMPCPFFGYVGPDTEVGVKDVEVSYTAFFQELILTSDIPSALIALQKSVPINKEIYMFINCEIYRKHLIDLYKKTFNDLGKRIDYKKKVLERAFKMNIEFNFGKSKKQIRHELDRIVFSKQEDDYLKESEDIFLHKKLPSKTLNKFPLN